MILFLGVGIRWLRIFRTGQPLDIDEAGYLGLSFLDYHGLIHNGLAGYFSAIEASSVQAPLTPALTALIYCVTGPNWIFGFGVPLLAGVGIIAASYALGRTLGCSRGAAGIGALLVGSCPIIINYSRSYHFALPATFAGKVEERWPLGSTWVSARSYSARCSTTPTATSWTIRACRNLFYARASSRK